MMSDTMIEGMLMTGMGTIGIEIITVTDMITITLQATTGGEKILEETTKTDTDRVTRTTDILIRNETLGKRIVGSRQRNTNRSRIGA